MITESIEVMVDGRSSGQPAPWRSRYQQNRATGSEDTVPTTTIKLGGGVSITLNGATTNQISNILDRATATRHVSHETDSSKDSTTTTQIGHQTIKNAKRRGRRQATAASKKAAAAGESGAETTSTVEEHDDRYTIASPQQDQHGHTTEDEPATAQDTDVYEEAEAPDAQKQLAPEKDTQAEEEEEQDEGEEEEEAKTVQTEVAEDRLASEEPEPEIETGEDALEVMRDLLSCTQADGQRMAERLAVMEKEKLLKEKEEEKAGKTPFSYFATERRTWAVVTGNRPQKGDNAVR